MHEQGLIENLIRRIAAAVAQEGGWKAVSATVQIGALAHISAEHLREHFERSVSGTVMEGMRLEVEIATDITAADAQDIVLRSVEVETGE